MSDAVLRLESVTKKFGSITAVNSISVEIGQREFVSLLGSSGSGKTTLLRMIAGLETPSRGRIFIHGRDVTARPPYDRKIGMVFQDYMLFPHRRVGENIVFPLRMQGVSRSEQNEQLGWALDLLRLKGLEDRYPHQLSGGQQQRVALARGLISRPSLLLLDEPLANLDRELRKEMEVEIRRYQLELGIPFIYVTHNQEEALAMSDRIAVMRGGAFEQIAPKSEVYRNPQTSFVAGFVGLSNRFDGRLSSVSGGYGSLDWQGVEITVPAPEGARAGDRVEYFVKCEQFGIEPGTEPSPGGTTNVIPARLRDVIFRGAGADYQIVTQNGTELTIMTATENAALSIGDPISIVWQAPQGHSYLSAG